MKPTLKLRSLLAITAIAAACLAYYPAGAAFQRNPNPVVQRITCSSNNGRRNWCDVGGTSNVRLARQISGSPCVRNDTWGVDRRGLWVDRGCRAEFVVAGGIPGPPPPRIVTCSSNNGIGSV